METDSALLQKAISFWRKGKYRKAILTHKKLLTRNPQFNEGWYHLGHVFKSAKKYKKAILSFEKCVQLNYRKYDTALQLSICYGHLYQYDTSYMYALKLTEIEPDNHESWLQLGSIYSSLKNKEKTVESIEKSLKIDPKSSVIYCNYGYCMLEFGEIRKARVLIEKSIFLGDKAHALINLGHINLIEGNEQIAIQNYLISIDGFGEDGFRENFAEDTWITKLYPVSRKNLLKARNKALKLYAEMQEPDRTFKTFIMNINPFSQLKKWIKRRTF